MQASRQVRSVVRRTEAHEATIHFGCLATCGERGLLVAVGTILIRSLDQFLGEGRCEMSSAKLAVNKTQAHADTHRNHGKDREHCASSLFGPSDSCRDSGCETCHDTCSSSAIT